MTNNLRMGHKLWLAVLAIIVLLLLAYVGSRFVLEVVLGKSA